MDQLTRPDEKGSSGDRNALADSDAFSSDEIRPVQMLLVLLSSLPPNGKLHEVLEHALMLPHEPCLARITPVKDTSPHGLKIWLESLWVRGGLTPAEQELVGWQRSGENIIAAVQELKEVERKLGLRFGMQRIS